MTVYTTLPTDDLNLAVEVTESNDMVTLNITPASVNVTSAVTSVNGLTGNVTLTTTEISDDAISTAKIAAIQMLEHKQLLQPTQKAL